MITLSVTDLKKLLKDISEDDAVELVQFLMQHISLEEQGIIGIGYLSEEE